MPSILPTGIKIDVFVAGDDPFDAERLAHRLRTQGARLDRARLADWAERLGVSDLLGRAWHEV